MKKLKLQRRLYASTAVTVMVVLVAVGLGVNAFSGATPSTVIEHAENVTVMPNGSGDVELGALTGPNNYYDMIFHRTIQYKEAITTVANGTSAATTTLDAMNSGMTYYLSATGTIFELPAVTYTGANYRFVINGASDTNNFIISSAEGDNIEGTLIVAGAVVDCAAEDDINFVVDGENIGDYVVLRSDGTQWLIGDSGALSASKLTCTNP